MIWKLMKYVGYFFPSFPNITNTYWALFNVPGITLNYFYTFSQLILAMKPSDIENI